MSLVEKINKSQMLLKNKKYLCNRLLVRYELLRIVLIFVLYFYAYISREDYIKKFIYKRLQ